MCAARAGCLNNGAPGLRPIKASARHLSMDGLRETILTVLDVRRRGGTLVERDAHTLILADYDYALQCALTFITDQYPRTSITLSRSAASSSGYIITFTRLHTQTVYTSSAFVHMLLTLALIWGAGMFLRPDCLLNFVE